MEIHVVTFLELLRQWIDKESLMPSNEVGQKSRVLFGAPPVRHWGIVE